MDELIDDKIEQLQRELFFLEMKDRWDVLDFEEADRIRNEIEELKNGRREII